MRVLAAVVVMLGLPAVAFAQSRPHDAGALPTLPTIGLPLPSITPPLPSIGLPLPPLGLPPATTYGHDAKPPVRPGPGPRPPGHGGLHRPAVVYAVYPYGWPVYEPAPAQDYPAAPPAAAPSAAPEERAGSLRLELEHLDGAAQVFVDNYFVGTIDDLGVELLMRPGPHTIEVHAEGFEALVFNASIGAGRTITYRAALTPLAGTPPAPAVAPSTLYLIPGCYLGNVPPDQIKLPDNCDLSRLITRKP